MEFIKTGVPGLDSLLKGGIKPGNSVLITGAPGTGKTILALQFVEQCVRDRKRSIYISTEESKKALMENAKSLGLILDKYEKNMLDIYEQQISDRIISLQKPLQLIRKKKIEIVVLDSLTLFEYSHPENKMELRKAILNFISAIKNMGSTLVAISEKETTNIDNFIYGMQDFLFDGLIIMSKLRKGASYERVLTVAKMKSQEHSVDIFPFSIKSNKGIEIYITQIPVSIAEV